MLKLEFVYRMVQRPAVYRIAISIMKKERYVRARVPVCVINCIATTRANKQTIAFLSWMHTLARVAICIVQNLARFCCIFRRCKLVNWLKLSIEANWKLCKTGKSATIKYGPKENVLVWLCSIRLWAVRIVSCRLYYMNMYMCVRFRIWTDRVWI